MKLNYYTYTIEFKSSGDIYKASIKDIVDIFCKHQKKPNLLEKFNEKTSRVLYFAKATGYISLYYLMTPSELQSYKSLDKTTGTISNLSNIIGSSSLEKVTYIDMDDKEPIIGIASPQGASTSEDIEFYLNEILNGLSNSLRFELKLQPLSTQIKKKDIRKVKFLSEAKLLMRNDSSQFSSFASFLNPKTNGDNIEIEVKIKRKQHVSADIKKDVDPLLNLIENDVNSSEFSEVYLRGKAQNLSENIKDIIFEKEMNLYDVINPSIKSPIENQIRDKRYKNTQIESLVRDYFSNLGNRVLTSPSSKDWIKLLDKNSY